MHKATKIEGVNLHSIESSSPKEGEHKVCIVFEDKNSENMFVEFLKDTEELPEFNETPAAVFIMDKNNRFIELIDKDGDIDLSFIKSMFKYELTTRTLDGEETSHGFIDSGGWFGKVV